MLTLLTALCYVAGSVEHRVDCGHSIADYHAALNIYLRQNLGKAHLGNTLKTVLVCVFPAAIVQCFNVNPQKQGLKSHGLWPDLPTNLLADLPTAVRDEFCKAVQG